MKKKVKALIIAASVAAIAGIGAVSFAAWAGGTQTKDTTDAVTGHVDTVGFGTGCTTTLSDALYPQDQDDDTVTKMYDIKLVVEGNDIASYELHGYYTAQKDSANHTWAAAAEAGGKAGLYYLIDTNATATYGESWTAWAPGTDYADLGYSSELAAGDYYVHVVLESSDAADMDVNLEFKFKLVNPSA